MTDKPRRALIVDDSAYARLMLQQVLEHHGVQVVVSAASPAEAVELYKKFQPDFVTMDLVMPDGGGVEAIKALYAMDPKAKIVVISALRGGLELQQARELGVIAVVHKPFEWPDLEKAIAEALS